MFFLLCMHTTCKHVIPICIPVSHKCISSPSPSRARAKRSPPEVWASGFCGRFANNKTPRRTAWGCHVRQENSHFFGDSLQHAGVQLSDLTNGDMSYLSIHVSIYLIPSIYALVKSPLMSSTACVMVALHPYICPGGYPIDDVRKSLLKSRHPICSTATIVKTKECGYIVMYHRCWNHHSQYPLVN